MGKFRLSAEAEADLVRIHQWGTVTYGEERADRYFAAFFDHFDALAEHPLAHPAVDDIREGYRRSVCGRDTVYYRIEGDVIVIAAIIGHQDVNEKFGKS